MWVPEGAACCASLPAQPLATSAPSATQGRIPASDTPCAGPRLTSFDPHAPRRLPAPCSISPLSPFALIHAAASVKLPEVVAKLREEQEAVIAKHGSEITKTALDDMTYAEAVVKEGQFWAPSGPFNFRWVQWQGAGAIGVGQGGWRARHRVPLWWGAPELLTLCAAPLFTALLTPCEPSAPHVLAPPHLLLTRLHLAAGSPAGVR
jgi:hypothetical protein